MADVTPELPIEDDPPIVREMWHYRVTWREGNGMEHVVQSWALTSVAARAEMFGAMDDLDHLRRTLYGTPLDGEGGTGGRGADTRPPGV